MTWLLNSWNASLIEFVKEGRIKEHGHPETENRTVSHQMEPDL